MTERTAASQIVDAVIPVYRPDSGFPKIIEKLTAQDHPVRKIILMVTLSEGEPLPEGIPDLSNVEIHRLLPSEFDHGETRNRGAACSDADYLLFLTQDAEPEDGHLISELLKGARFIETLTRSFNYPEEPRVQDLESLPRYGVKTYFLSNAAAMYDRRIFESLGGFTHRTIFNEDMIYAFQLVQAGYRIRYVPSAVVRHSHHYTAREEFSRNFDLGVSQADHPEIFESVSSEKEGASMVKTVLKELFKAGKGYLVFTFFHHSAMKYLGYRKGKNYRKLPEKKVRRYSMNKNYWERYYGTDQSDAL